MAQLSGTQKKQKSRFITLLVAIVVVLAAIVYVVYGEVTSHSKFLADEKFAEALSETLGKAPLFLSENDLASVKYLGVSYDSETVQVVTGGDEFVDKYNEYTEKQEAGEDVSDVDLSKYVKIAAYDEKEAPTLDDLAYFTGVRNIEVSGIKVTDSSVFSGMTAIEDGSFYAIGLTEVAGFAGINADTLNKLSLNGNDITDWSPLDALADKVIVSASYMLTPSEDGTVDFSNMTYVEQTLTEYYEEQAEAEAADDEAAEDETTEDETVEGENADAEGEADTDEGADVAADAVVEPETDVEAEADADAEVDAEAEVEVDAEAEADVDADAETDEEVAE